MGIVAHDGYLYWSNPGVDDNNPGSTIGRSKIDGTAVTQTLITGLDSPHSLAISGGYIYWASRLGDTIGRARLNGTHGDRHFVTGVAAPWGLTVHGNYVFWTNYGVGASSSGTTIGRARLNGTHVDQHFIVGASAPPVLPPTIPTSTGPTRATAKSERLVAGRRWAERV